MNSESAVRGTSIPLDLVFELLASSRRRLLLYQLNDAPDGTATVDTLVRFISVYENEPSLERLRVALKHTHLPKLAGAGIIEYDRRSETVRYRPHPSIEEWLEHANHIERDPCC